MKIEALSLEDTYKKIKTKITSDDLIIHSVGKETGTNQHDKMLDI